MKKLHLQNIIRNGDVDIFNIKTRGIKSIPDEAKSIGKTVMHGESGHKHTIKSGQVLLLENSMEIQTSSGIKQVEKFLHIPQDTIISHEEHLPLQIPKGDYVVLQEREIDHLAEVERSVLD